MCVCSLVHVPFVVAMKIYVGECACTCLSRCANRYSPDMAHVPYEVIFSRPFPSQASCSALVVDERPSSRLGRRYVDVLLMGNYSTSPGWLLDWLTDPFSTFAFIHLSVCLVDCLSTYSPSYTIQSYLTQPTSTVRANNSTRV